jgi:hypothetical protein
VRVKPALAATLLSLLRQLWARAGAYQVRAGGLLEMHGNDDGVSM